MLLLHGDNRYHAKEHEYQGTEIAAENTYRAELGLHVYGRSTQDGIPSPESPIPINSIGDSGSVDVMVSDNNGNSQTLTINTPNGLCGIPVDTGGNYTDSTGQQWVCDEIDFERGVFVQKLKKAIISDVTWRITVPREHEFATDVLVKNNKTYYYVNGFCDMYDVITSDKNRFTNKSVIFGINGWQLFVCDNNFSTIDEIKLFFTNNPITILYQLIEPIETPLTAEELAAYKAIKSYPHYTHIKSAAELKAKLKIF